MWQAILDGIDRVESWVVLLPAWIQIPLLLVVLVPLAWGLARVIDPLVEGVLDLMERPRRRRADAPVQRGEVP